MSVDPGEGYRLLQVGEKFREGDQCQAISDERWIHIFPGRYGLPFNDNWTPTRRKIEPPTGIEAIVCADITARQRAGIAKYGTTVKDNPLSLKEWLQHAYEECLDQAVYLRRAIDEL